jgi:hypothetical protein
MRLPVEIDRYERDVSAARVLSLAGENILSENLHANFHRRAKYAVHARLQNDPLAYVDREAEIHVVDRRRHHMTV